MLLLLHGRVACKKRDKTAFECPGIWSGAVSRLPFVVVVVDQSIVREVAK